MTRNLAWLGLAILLAGCAGRGTGGSGTVSPLPLEYGYVFVAGGELMARSPATTPARMLADGLGATPVAVVSPDGTRVAFLASHGGQIDLFVVPVGGGSPTQVTDDAGAESSIAWRPDSGALAFLSADRGLVVAQADGSAPLPLNPNILLSDLRAVAWSGTANLLVIADRLDPFAPADDQVFRIEYLTGNAVKLTDLAVSVQAVSGSPSGARIAYWAFAGSSSGLFVADSDGDGPVRVTPDADTSRYSLGGLPLWLDENTLLAIIDDAQTDESSLIRIPVDGEWSPVFAATSGSSLRELRISGDARFAVFAVQTGSATALGAVALSDPSFLGLENTGFPAGILRR